MRRLLGCTALTVVLAAGMSVQASAARTGGVPPGTPVTVRANPDNAIVAATRAAAADVGLGPVEAVGFSPDCSPRTGRVIVCRNPQLHKKGARAVTVSGLGYCVVRTDPSLGGAQHGITVMTTALRKCLISP